MATYVVTVIILILLNAFFSASDMAFVFSDKLRIEIKAKNKSASARALMAFVKNPAFFFTAVLLFNYLSLVALVSATVLFLTAWFSIGGFYLILIPSLLIFLFDEIIPRYFARKMPERIILLNILPLRILFYILYPFIKMISSGTGFIEHTEKTKEENIGRLFGRQQMKIFLQENRESGIENTREADIINRIMELGDQRVYEIMRPRTDIAGIEINSTMDELLEVFIESGYSKIPVYEDSLDNIKGVVFAYDLFKRPDKLTDIIRNVIFVPDTKKSTQMLREFLEKRISFAVAIDEFGGTAGVLTMEDIIEELFGEIKDEYDTEDEICRKVAENVYVISGKSETDLINETFELNIPEGDYTTLGGFITYNIGRIPVQGETLKIGRFQIKILRSSQIHIDLVKIHLQPEN